MKSPLTGKKMKLIREKRQMVFRKEEFTYFHHAFQDEDYKETFTTTRMDELNLLQVYNQYREQNRIPFPKEIIEIRKKYGVSAKKMSMILGFGVNSYRNYENGEMPSVSNARLIQSIKSSEEFLNMVELCVVLSKDEREKLIKRTKTLIEQERINRNENRIKAYFLGDDLADRFTGYRTPNLDKFIAMIIFFAEQMSPFKTKMNKLLFYADFLNYKNSCYSISGIRYQAWPHGPVPVKYQSIYEFMIDGGLLDIQTIDFPEGYTGIRFTPKEGCQFREGLFTDDELKVLKKVAETFKTQNASKISEISHLEKAWLQNEQQKNLIDYNFAFELRQL